MKHIYLALSINLVMTSLVFAQTNGENLDIGRVKEFQVITKCEKIKYPTLPSTLVGGKYAIVYDIDVIDQKGKIFFSYNSENLWFFKNVPGGKSLQACNETRSRYDQHLHRFDQMILLAEAKKYEGIVFRSEDGKTCHKKVLVLSSRPLSFPYHPVTGEMPQMLIIKDKKIKCPTNTVVEEFEY